MKIKNQVCTYEQSKRLNELGVTAESYFTWLDCKKVYENGEGEFFPCLFQKEKHGELMCVAYPDGDTFQDYGEDGEFWDTKGNYPAFTVSELGVMLDLEMNILHYIIYENEKCFVSGSLSARFKNQAESYAEQLIHCLEKGYLTCVDCNKRLIAA